jgi:hypothetical protein
VTIRFASFFICGIVEAKKDNLRHPRERVSFHIPLVGAAKNNDGDSTSEESERP